MRREKKENFLQSHYNRYRNAGGDHVEYIVFNDLDDNRDLCEELSHNYEKSKSRQNRKKSKKALIKNTEIITLCGSTKFDEALRKLTLEGKIVFSIENIDRNKVNKEQKKKLEELHFKKIYLSDGIYVIDINEYIGEGTKREINYAIKNNKFVRYYSRERNT